MLVRIFKEAISNRNLCRPRIKTLRLCTFKGQLQISRMKYILSVALALLLSHFSFGQKEKTFIDSVEQTIADIKEELILIKENYYVIQPIGLAGNIGVYVGAEGGVIVDNQWSRLVPRIKELLKALTDKPVKYVINTHYHFDHIDGNKSFGKERVTIVAHKNLRARLLKDQLISGSGFGPILQKAYPPKGLPSIYIQQFN